MTDVESIGDRLGKLEEYIGYLKNLQRHSLEDLKKDPTLRGAVERYLQLSVECVVDIGEILISSLKLPKPETSRQVIDILGQEGIIPDNFAYRFAPVAGFRNILVHNYLEVDLEEVYNHLQNDLADFSYYAKCIGEWLQKHSGD